LLRELDAHLVETIEHFFVSYNEMAGKQFRPVGPVRAPSCEQTGTERGEAFLETEAERSGGRQRPVQGFDLIAHAAGRPTPGTACGATPAEFGTLIAQAEDV